MDVVCILYIVRVHEVANILYLLCTVLVMSGCTVYLYYGGHDVEHMLCLLHAMLIHEVAKVL